MAAFTEAEIDAMKGARLRSELMALGANRTDIGKTKVADLKVLLKQKCGITQGSGNTTTPVFVMNTRSQGAGNTTTPAQNTRVMNMSTPAQNTAGGTTKDRDDLVKALVNCNMSKVTAEQLITTQAIKSLRCLKEFSPDDMESTISRHNKAMTGANEAYKIFSTIIIKKLSALVHSVRVYSLTGADFPLDDWTYDWQISRAMKELELFQLGEKNATEAKALKDVVSAVELLGEKPYEVFDLVATNFGQRKSSHGCGATLAYVVGSATTTNLINPSHAERLNQGLLKSGDAYDKDNATVYEIIEEWAQDEKISDHIKPFKKAKDGRSAFLALKAIYLGKSSADSALIRAQGAVSDGQEGLVYNGEVAGNSGMPWATYVGKLNSNFDIIEQHSGDTYSQKSRVLRLLKGIKGDAAQQQIIVIACENVKDITTYLNDYHKAAAFLQQKIQGVYAQAIANRSKNQTVKETTTGQSGQGGGGRGNRFGHWSSGRGYRGRGRGRGFDGRGSGGRGRGRGSGRPWGNPAYDGHTEHKELYGVDVTDVWKDFDDSVFHGAVRTYVMNRRTVLRAKGIYGNSDNSNDMKVSEATTKRNSGGDNNPRDAKQPKTGEDNDYQRMHEKE